MKLPVTIAMEGFNGCARPLDYQIRARGYRLFSVNNLKLARYKEIFPSPAKTDAIDAFRILELIRLSCYLPVAKDALQEVIGAPPENDQLKRLTRRRRQLVSERAGIANRMQADLRAVCPELLLITKAVKSLWFLSFLTCRPELTQLARLREATLMRLRGVGCIYAKRILAWQKHACFAPEIKWVGSMIIEDAKRMLALSTDIKALDKTIAALAKRSELACRIGTIPGFGDTSRAELAGEIGTVLR